MFIVLYILSLSLLFCSFSLKLTFCKSVAFINLRNIPRLSVEKTKDKLYKKHTLSRDKVNLYIFVILILPKQRMKFYDKLSMCLNINFALRNSLFASERRKSIFFITFVHRKKQAWYWKLISNHARCFAFILPAGDVRLLRNFCKNRSINLLFTSLGAYCKSFDIVDQRKVFQLTR